MIVQVIFCLLIRRVYRTWVFWTVESFLRLSGQAKSFRCKSHPELSRSICCQCNIRFRACRSQWGQVVWHFIRMQIINKEWRHQDFSFLSSHRGQGISEKLLSHDDALSQCVTRLSRHRWGSHSLIALILNAVHYWKLSLLCPMTSILLPVPFCNATPSPSTEDGPWSSILTTLFPTPQGYIVTPQRHVEVKNSLTFSTALEPDYGPLDPPLLQFVPGKSVGGGRLVGGDQVTIPPIYAVAGFSVAIELWDDNTTKSPDERRGGLQCESWPRIRRCD